MSRDYRPSHTAQEWKEQGWGDEPVQVDVPAKLESTISIRLDGDSAGLVRRAARLTGRTLSQFVREATMRSAKDIVASHEKPPAIVVRKFEQLDPSAQIVTRSAEPAVGTLTGTGNVLVR